ncbi:protein Star [Procambarus clarkii]|uniref:protein Star n=1 Tax=Procambarus clarkii TaxID=6728 RepID=UPI001E673844|nr:protein Star-like [Procambarus clarkii]
MGSSVRWRWWPRAVVLVATTTVISSPSWYWEAGPPLNPPSPSPTQVPLKDSSTRDEALMLVHQKTHSEAVLTDKPFVSAHQEDPALVSYLRHQLAPPSALPYNLTNPEKQDFSQFGQPLHLVKNLLHGMKGGFFVEAGAVDGEFLSNTLYLERWLGWTGLLVEPYPVTYERLLYKHRRAYSINAALSVTNVSSSVFLRPAGDNGVLSTVEERGLQVRAIPLFSLLKALNVTIVDFLSLDVEGDEVKVLKTIPWDKIRIRVLCVEFNHVPEGHRRLRRYVVSKGYRFLAYRKIDMWFGWPSLLAQTMRG